VKAALVTLVTAIALAGCSTAAVRVPAVPGEGAAEPVRPPDCSRRFDENEAGFQTCEENPPTQLPVNEVSRGS
jgi:hypothetical protein